MYHAEGGLAPSSEARQKIQPTSGKVLSGKNYKAGKCPCAAPVGASGATFLTTMGGTDGSDHTEDCQEGTAAWQWWLAREGCRSALARAEFGRIVLLRATEDSRNEVSRLRVLASGIAKGTRRSPQ